jgi:hypothetical protein
MEWALQVHTIQLVEAFADMGHGVDVFLHATDNPGIVGTDPFKRIPHVRVFNSNPVVTDEVADPGDAWINRQPRMVRGLERIYREVHDMVAFSVGRRGPDSFALTRRLLERGFDSPASYLFAVGVEGAGFVWASSAMNGRCPVYYYSLELFLDRHPIYQGWKFRALKRREHYWLARSAGLLIQDRFRATEFLNSVGLPQNHCAIFPLPVSVRRLSYPEIRTLRGRLGVGEKQILILYLGNLEPRRGCVELCKLATGFPADWTLVLHGRWMGPASYRLELERYRNHPRIRFSEEMVPTEHLGDFIAGCDVGLAFYSNHDINHYHTGYSSEKIALYFSRGIPVVSNNYPSQMEVFDRWKCGMGVDSIHDSLSAVAEMLKERVEYEQGALAAFHECYDFDACKRVLATVAEHAEARKQTGRED